MNYLTVLASGTYCGLRSLFGGRKLTWAELERWMHHGGGNPANHGRGYAGGRPLKNRAAHIEMHRTKRGDKWSVQALLILDPRQGAASRESWLVDGFDSKLAKRFGDNHRFTIQL